VLGCYDAVEVYRKYSPVDNLRLHEKIGHVSSVDSISLSIILTTTSGSMLCCNRFLRQNRLIDSDKRKVYCRYALRESALFKLL